MDKDFTPYEIALALKQLGFDEKCIELYSEFGELMYNYLQKKFKLFTNSEIVTINKNNPKIKICTAPTFSQAFRFFREKYSLDSHIKKGKHGDYILVITGYLEDSWDEYEEAELECLKKLIEIVKSQS